MSIISLKSILIASVFMSSVACVYADDSLENQVNSINDQLGQVMSSLKSKNLDASFFTKTDDGYIRILSSVEDFKGKPMKDEISKELMKNGKYQASNVDIGGKTCSSVFYKTFDNGSYAISVGKDCK